MTNTIAKLPLKLWCILAAGLCAASNMAHAAPVANFTDTWKDTPAPDSIVGPSTAGAFSFHATLAIDGEITTSDLTSNSQFSLSVGPEGNTVSIISDSLGDAGRLKLGSSGSATFPIYVMNLATGNETENGTVTVSWSAATITVSGTSSADVLGEEAMFAADSDGVPGDNTFSTLTTNEVTVSLDAFNEDTNVTGTLKNTETEYTSDGNFFPLEAGSVSGAGAGISFSDTWKDTALVDIPKAPSTAGTFSFSASLPVDGEIVTGDLDSNSQFSLNLAGVTIVADTLGDAEGLKLGTTGKATFPILVMNPISGNETEDGNMIVSWTANTITITGTSTADVLGEESVFAGLSIGIAASNTVNTLATNEVTVSLDAFNEDTNVTGKLKNMETEYSGSDGTNFPLEAGSLTGAGGGITFSDTWKDTAAPAGYYASTSGSGSIDISLPLNGFPGMTNAGFDASEVGTNSQLSLSIGPVGNLTPFFSDTFSDAKKFSENKNGGSATFVATPRTGSLTVTWTATTISVTASTDFEILGEEAMFASNSDGIASDNTGPIDGFYGIALTLNDTNGGAISYQNSYVPVTGKNTETEQNNSDGTTFPLEAGTVTGMADFTPPKVAITSPASGFKVYNEASSIDLQGTASDKEGVASIWFYINGDINNAANIDQQDLPTNSISWSVPDLDFSQFGGPGTYVVSVFAVDSIGNISAPVSRTFQWVQASVAVVTVVPSNAGKVTGLKTGQQLQVGESYSVTATATNKNFIFSQWTDASGDVLSSNATFEYYDTDGTLTANFVANPFNNPDLAGTYTALYFDANDESVVRDDGYITVTVTSAGAYTGKIYNADYSKTTGTFSGQLSEAPDGGFATATPPLVLFGKSDYLQVNLQIATDPILTDPGAGLMTGFVNSFNNKEATNASDSAEIMGELSFYNTKILPGLYNIVIAPVSGDPSQGPGGYSYGTATVSNKKGSAGSVALVLHLADGVSPAISFSSALAQDGSCPIYTALYGGNAVLLGWMQFATNGSGGMTPATLTWFTENYDDALLPRGVAFSAQPLLSGGLYLAPKAGTNIFGATALTFAIDPGYTNLSLQDETDVAATFDPVKNTFTDSSSVTITLTPSTGALTGSFYPPGSRTPLKFNGVEFGGLGYGFYTAANKETGPVSLGDPTDHAVFGEGQNATMTIDHPNSGGPPALPPSLSTTPGHLGPQPPAPQ